MSGTIGGFSLDDLIAEGVKHVRHAQGKTVSEDFEERPRRKPVRESPSKVMVAVPVARTGPMGLQKATARPPKATAYGEPTNAEIMARMVRIEKKLDWLIGVLRQG